MSLLETKRLLMRAPVQGDMSAVRAQLSSYEIAKWLAKVPHPYPQGHEDTWWQRIEERRKAGVAGHFMVVHKGANTFAARAPIGCAVISPRQDGTSRLGYWLDEPWWGQGLMSEAVAAVIDHTCATQKPAAIVAGYFEGNEGSAAILRRQGFVPVDITQEWCEARGKTLIHHNLIRQL